MGATTSQADPSTIGTAITGWCKSDIGVALAASIVAVVLLAAVALRTVAAAPALAVIALVPAAVVDVRERRLPDVWVATACVAFLAATLVTWAAGDQPPFSSMIVGGLVAAGPILLLHLVSPAAMGFGDVKAAAVIGLAMGSADWRLALVALTLAAGSAGVYGVAARARSVAFGPFLVLGATVALLFSSTWLGPVADVGVAP